VVHSETEQFWGKNVSTEVSEGPSKAEKAGFALVPYCLKLLAHLNDRAVRRSRPVGGLDVWARPSDLVVCERRREVGHVIVGCLVYNAFGPTSERRLESSSLYNSLVLGLSSSITMNVYGRPLHLIYRHASSIYRHRKRANLNELRLLLVLPRSLLPNDCL